MKVFTLSTMLILSHTALEAGQSNLPTVLEKTVTPIEIDLNGFLDHNGPANRILAGDMLRSLSQEIPASVCHLHNDIDTDEAAEVLAYSIAAFDLMVNALLYGDETVGIIGQETRRKTVVELQALKDIWEPVYDASLVVLDDPTDSDAVEVVYASTDVMLDKTYHLLSVIEGEYANPTEILQADVMLLEISGRMAAFNQRLAYETCRVWSGGGSAEMKEDLLKTMSFYESSLEALTLGMPSLGVQPPPTQEIADKLAELTDHWDEIHDQLIHVAEGDEIAIPVREALYHDLIVKLHHVEELEVLYQNYSKRIF